MMFIALGFFPVVFLRGAGGCFVISTGVFSCDLNVGKLLVQSVLNRTLMAIGCAEQLFTVFLPATDVSTFHSLALISLRFGSDICC